MQEPTTVTTTRRKRRMLWLKLPLLVIALAILTTYIVFPSTSDFRSVIAGADRIEVRIFRASAESKDKLILTLDDKKDLRLLADSFRIWGLWLPLDELIANSYRVRAIKGSDSTDITVRGTDLLKHGNWFVRISPTFWETIVDLVSREGGHIPSLRERKTPEG